MGNPLQTTLKSAVTFTGTGLHTGKLVRLTVLPASAEYGVWFERTDVTDRDPMVPARWDAVSNTDLNTRISNADGVSVSTIEHLMAALAGCGVHNALIKIDGPEVPLLDGSSAPFVSQILARGVRELDAPVRSIRVLKPVTVTKGKATATLLPSEELEIDFEIDFADSVIGQQSKKLNMANGAFVRELSDSRTFCRKADIDMMRERGLIVGGSVTSAVVVEDDEVVTPGGMRHQDEPVRHKMLDALGDLTLAGAPIMGRYVGHRSGHAMTNLLLRALFADPTNYELIECDKAMSARLPGAGVKRSDGAHRMSA
jgi:UDP-3-O-[3-hydroxymyristoyl] N-acetylglucosamine deacetylase